MANTNTKSQLPERVVAQRASVVDAIIRDMSSKGLQWTEDIIRTASPHNPITGTRYRGTNRTNLAAIAKVRGLDDSRWMTWTQIQRAGLRVKRGARAAHVEKWKLMPVPVTDGEDENENPRRVPRCVGSFPVFNGAEIEGMPQTDEMRGRVVPVSELMKVGDDLIASSRCEVRQDRVGAAYYSPTLDLIHMPLPELFLGDTDDARAEHRVATLLHEMAHSTAPAVKRPLPAEAYGTPDYAREELVAELGALFVASDLGIRARRDLDDPHWQSHLAYLQSWSRMLHNRPAELYRAAAFADIAAGFIVERYRAQCAHVNDESAEAA